MNVELPDCYKNMLTWTMTDDIIKAVPKKPLSYTAHRLIEKAFKKAGGACVRNNGSYHFELVLKAKKLRGSNEVARAYRKLMEKGIFEEK